MVYVFILLLTSYGAFAPPPGYGLANTVSHTSKFSAGMESTDFAVTSYERVYILDNLNSELIWTHGGIPMYGPKVEYCPTNHSKISAAYYHSKSKHPLIGSNSDADWRYTSDQEQIQYSYSNSIAEVSSAQYLDISAEFPLMAFEPAGSKQSLLMPKLVVIKFLSGLKITNVHWVTHGADVWQNDKYNIGHETDDYFQIETSVTPVDFNHVFGAPYVGLSSELTYEAFSISGAVRYSNQVSHESLDIHGLRYLAYHDSATHGTLLGLDVALKYQPSDKFTITTTFTQDFYRPVRGHTNIYDYENEDEYDFPSSAGFESKTRGIHLGVSYSFW
ncbi:MAG: omptin family outer membrane protease [Pseudomonadota bacterium]